jgi:hypothetical protein
MDNINSVLPTQKYAFVFAASENYHPGVMALINSIKDKMPYADICLYLYKYSEEKMAAFADAQGIYIEFADETKDQQKSTAFGRYKYAADLTDKYDSVCLIDADMFVTADCYTFFDVAKHGFIITGSNGMVVNFNRAHQEKYGIDLGVDNYIYTKIHTSVPIFINKDNRIWFDEFVEINEAGQLDDFLGLNLLGISMAVYDKMICMPPYMFTGIHHWQVKPATRVFRIQDTLMTKTEEQVYMCHGKFWWENYIKDMMMPMESYYKEFQLGEKNRDLTMKSINDILYFFNYYYNDGEILI